jgi:hypothetical protein
MTAIANDITGLQKLLKNDILQRVVKTVVEVVVAQTALYTTVVPNPPKTTTSAALAGGAVVLSLLWNALTTWAASSKSKRLVALQAAIETAAQKIVAEQAANPKV